MQRAVQLRDRFGSDAGVPGTYPVRHYCLVRNSETLQTWCIFVVTYGAKHINGVVLLFQRTSSKKKRMCHKLHRVVEARMQAVQDTGHFVDTCLKRYSVM